MIAESILALSAALARGDDPPVRTFTSPSGVWSLSVSRPEKDWNGSNELVLAHAEVEVWRATLALGLRLALVDEDGRVAGYGYTGEPAADGRPVAPDGPLGSVLRVFSFDPSGRLVLDESHARGMPLHPDGQANPRVRGAFLAMEPGRFVLRVDDEDLNRGAEKWWAYDLASGAVLFRERPRTKLGLPDALGPLLDARAVPGTPLVLLQWKRVESLERSFRITNVYQLLDPDWKLVWTRELTSEKRRAAGQDWLTTGGRGTSLGPARFELYPQGGGEPLAFDVRREGEGWSVSEVAR